MESLSGAVVTEPSGEIRDITQAVQIGIKLRHSWFRGHVEAVDKLTPRFYRRYGDSLMRGLRPAREMELIEAFKRNARPIATSDQLPEEDDILGWLYLMQHYRTPTRLLDWTESVLAAVYFAVSDEESWEDDGEDGELWGLVPHVLNRVAYGREALPLPGRNPVIDYLAREPYWRNSMELARTVAEEFIARSIDDEWCDDPKPITHPVAFRPRRDFARMQVQSSVFTIHPRDRDGTIPESLTDDRHLARYIIPAEAKKHLWEQLRKLGVTAQSLFPDFEGLSRTIAPPSEMVARGPYSDPPRFPPYDDAEED